MIKIRKKLIRFLITISTFYYYLLFSHGLLLIKEPTQHLRLQKAIQIEAQLSVSLENYLQYIQQSKESTTKTTTSTTTSTTTTTITTTTTTTTIPTALSFPSVRQCNEALATFGDSGDLIRALKLFGLMRKATTSTWTLYKESPPSPHPPLHHQHHHQSLVGILPMIPFPNLVTYSTLMSRAVALGKAQVALRLWRLGTVQNNLYSGFLPESNRTFIPPMVPDIRAINILMNALAKLTLVSHAWLLLHQLFSHRYNNTILHNSQHHQPPNDWIHTLILDSNIPHDISPNIITYNTLIDACHRVGDLDLALEALTHLRTWAPNIQPDTTTFTSLISTVARKSTKTSGAQDPDIAFALMEEMISLQIQPNGMTYCALIDVCGRCRRSDLALKVLRIMVRKKRNDSRAMVGAWTAAMNACGKAGRVDTAIRLFDTMQKFGVKPNGITCGCLMDCLLRNNVPSDSMEMRYYYVGELLDILRFMKEEEIAPTEHMYTSLMRYAESITVIENTIQANQRRSNRKGEITPSSETLDMRLAWKRDSARGSNKAIDLYTELMISLISPSTNSSIISSNSKSTLVKVFLVFQQMRAAGTEPDLASYNALLGACSRAGDVSRLFDVLKRIYNDGFIPDSTTWKEMVRGIGKSMDTNGVVDMWKWALSQRGKENGSPWVPTIDALEALVLSFWKQASQEGITPNERKRLCHCILDFYAEAQGRKDVCMGLHAIPILMIHSNRKIMLILGDVCKILGEPLPTSLGSIS